MFEIIFDVVIKLEDNLTFVLGTLYSHLST